MEYENDPLLPILQGEIQQRTAAYKSLTALEEQKLLMLNEDQKQAILAQDKSAKQGYLSAQPALNHAGVKAHPKYLAYEASIGASH